MNRWVLVLIIGLTLTACQAAPEPTATETPTSTVEESNPPLPTNTSAPTWTPTPESTPIPVDTPTPAPTPTPVPNDVWVNSLNGLNLRAEAKTTASLVATLKDKQHLVADGPTVGPDAAGITWQNVHTDDNQIGFVSTQFLTTTNPAGAGTPAATLPATAAAPAAATVAATTAPATVTGDVYVIALEGLNLRAQSNSTSNVIVIVAYGQHLTALGTPLGPDAASITWQNVRTDDGKTGWVAAQFISTTKPAAATPTPTTAPVTPTATLTATTPTTSTALGDVWVIANPGLFLRAQPATTGAVVATLVYGQRVTALAAKTAPDATGIAWQNVRTAANQTGYAAADFLSTTPVTPTATVTTTSPITATTSPITATATPTKTTSSDTLPANVVAAAPVSAVTTGAAANELYRRINELRAQNGLPSLAWNDLLATAALDHNQDMAMTGNISHTGSNGTLEDARVQAAGYATSAADEVIYAGRNGLEPVWRFWSTDRTHYRVLVSPRYTEIGVSVFTVGDRAYYTADFGKPQ